MKKIILILLILLFIVGTTKAQKETYWWYFGEYAGLNFLNTQTVNTQYGAISGLPTYARGPINTYEGCFTISDKEGNFIFASDGMTVYNKNMQIMANGTGLLGDPSSTQSGIAIPKPGSKTEYYLVTVPAINTANRASGLRYSIVDLSLNGGLGAVTSKNLQLSISPLSEDKVAENLAVVGHANGIDYWMLSRIETKIYVWQITKDGFSTPKTYEVGVRINGQGNLRMTTDGTKFAHVDHHHIVNNVAPVGEGNLTYADFNPDTGIVSNIKVYTTGIRNIYGVEFSPNGEYLYITAVNVDKILQPNGLRSLFVKHVSNLNPPYTPSPHINNHSFNIERGPGGRIFGISGVQTDYSGDQVGTRSLYCILNPDEGGSQFIEIPNFFPSNAAPKLGLPPFITSFFTAGDLEMDPPSVCINQPQEFSMYLNTGTGINSITKLEWDFGDGTAKEIETDMTKLEYTKTHTYTILGTFTFTLTPYRADGTILTDKIQKHDIVVGSCMIPVNHNITNGDY